MAITQTARKNRKKYRVVAGEIKRKKA